MEGVEGGSQGWPGPGAELMEGVEAGSDLLTADAAAGKVAAVAGGGWRHTQLRWAHVTSRPKA